MKKTEMMSLLLYAIGFIFWSPGAVYAEVVCPAPISQTAQDLSGEGRIRMNRLMGIDLQGKATAVTKDLLHDYPNADKVALANAMISVTCEFVKASSLRDAVKLEEISKLRRDIMEIVGVRSSSLPQFEVVSWTTPSVKAEMTEAMAEARVNSGHTAAIGNNNCYPPPLNYLGKTNWQFVSGTITRVDEQYTCNNGYPNAGTRTVSLNQPNSICLEAVARAPDPSAIAHCTTTIRATIHLQRPVN
jgi:hypothetical protein